VGTGRVVDGLSFAPFGFYSKTRKPEGYDVDIAKAMSEQPDMKLSLIDTSADNRIPNLMTKKVDAVLCNFKENPQCATQINFTNPYVIAGEYLLVKKSSGIKGIGGLNGKTVTVNIGSTDVQLIAKANPKATMQSYPNDDVAILAVKTGQVDTIIEDLNYLTYQAKLDLNLEDAHQRLVPLEYNGFGVQLLVMNGASDLLREAFEEAGRPAREDIIHG
jgi:polar amino acid transport system substrate-binding protein